MDKADHRPPEPLSEERLPWLEAVDEAMHTNPRSRIKLVSGISAALIAVMGVIALIWFVKARVGADEDGNGALIAAPRGDYKTKPDEPGGMTVAGKGDATFATSEGAEAIGTIDTSALPEAPLASAKLGPKPAGAPVAASSETAGPVASVKLSEVKTVALRPPVISPTAAKPITPPAPKGTMIQIGAYASQASASQSWTLMNTRFAFLKPLEALIVPVTANGKTLYRLRADAGSGQAANAICAKLRVAGENCLILP